MQTLRLADPESARRYPLPIRGELTWQRREGGFEGELPIPALAPGSIVVPSLTLHGPTDYPYRWSLADGARRWVLPGVPAQPGPTAVAGAGAAPVTTHVDCFHVHERLEQPVLHVFLSAERAPARYLACVSARPLRLDSIPVPGSRAGCIEAPPGRSQMTAPAEIAPRICSPTCVSMVLASQGRSHDWLTLVAECRDPATGMYGVWPLALEAARRRGSQGAVELFDDWREPLDVLARGIPLVTSIRFERDGLPGAPLVQTGGHLVVLYAAGPDSVRVCDPAAQDDAGVDRSYPARAFSQAWLRHRGAAYILPP